MCGPFMSRRLSRAIRGDSTVLVEKCGTGRLPRPSTWRGADLLPPPPRDFGHSRVTLHCPHPFVFGHRIPPLRRPEPPIDRGSDGKFCPRVRWKLAAISDLVLRLPCWRDLNAVTHWILLLFHGSLTFLKTELYEPEFQKGTFYSRFLSRNLEECMSAARFLFCFVSSHFFGGSRVAQVPSPHSCRSFTGGKIPGPRQDWGSGGCERSLSDGFKSGFELGHGEKSLWMPPHKNEATPCYNLEPGWDTGYSLPAAPRGPFRAANGGTAPGLTSVASFVDHEHIGADAYYPTDITL